MEKASLHWKKVQVKNSQHIPSPRWGHACCVVDDEIVFFGGYADNNYMNDMWIFNATTSQWKEVNPTGDIPEQRSNCTMNFDAKREQVVVFGGGGPKKKRFNTLHVMDWKTKVCTKKKFPEGSKLPIKRTYHTAELVTDYLIVFGGEGQQDIDDLWVFDFQASTWTQIELSDQAKPTARRFHSSAFVNNQMYIIGGCHCIYRSLNSIFSLDLTSLIQRKDYSSLRWKEVKLDGASCLVRWGHSSNVYDGKIFVFAGRSNNSLNDLLVIDVENSTIKLAIKNPKQAPAPRRKHSAAFIGSSLVVFGGFNDEYLNDFHYINVEDHSKVWQVNRPEHLSNKLNSCVNDKDITNARVTLSTRQSIAFNHQLLSQGFKGKETIPAFISHLSTSCSYQQATQYIKFASTQVGPIKESVHSKYKMKGNPTTQNGSSAKNYSTLLIKSLEQYVDKDFYTSTNLQSGVIELSKCKVSWQQILNILQQDMQLNIELKVGQEKFRCCKTLLTLNSKYFRNMIAYSKTNKFEIKADPRIFRYVLLFILSDYLIVQRRLSLSDLVEIIKISQFYHLQRLTSICKCQCLLYCTYNASSVLTIAIEHKLKDLKNFCAEVEIKREIALKNDEVVNPFIDKTVNIEEINKESSSKLMRLQSQVAKYKRNALKRCYFDIVQTKALKNNMQTKHLEKSVSTKEFENKNENLQLD